MWLYPLDPLVWPFCTKDNVPTTIYHYFTASTAYCVHWFDLFVSKTMSQPPYTTIPLHPLCPLHPLVWPFCAKDNVPTTIYHYYTASTAYCIHWFDLFAPRTMSPPSYTTIPLCTASTAYCIHWFDLFVSKTMSPPPYTTILLHPLHTASTPSSHLCVILTQPDICLILWGIEIALMNAWFETNLVAFLQNSAQCLNLIFCKVTTCDQCDASNSLN